jgi:hypothetical protein
VGAKDYKSAKGAERIRTSFSSRDARGILNSNDLCALPRMELSFIAFAEKGAAPIADSRPSTQAIGAIHLPLARNGGPPEGGLRELEFRAQKVAPGTPGPVQR